MLNNAIATKALAAVNLFPINTYTAKVARETCSGKSSKGIKLSLYEQVTLPKVTRI